jgi:hypothetical protein
MSRAPSVERSSTRAAVVEKPGRITSTEKPLDGVRSFLTVSPWGVYLSR